MVSETHFRRLETLVRGALDPPPGGGQIALALTFGVAVPLVFAAAIAAMIFAMYFGMSRSIGSVPWPYASMANAFLVLQFPLVHSFLLTGPGMRVMLRLVPVPHAGTMSTTTYALIASLQLLALFAFWTPREIFWWRAEGWTLYIVTAAYASAWALLIRASWDAGVAVRPVIAEIRRNRKIRCWVNSHFAGQSGPTC